VLVIEVAAEVAVLLAVAATRGHAAAAAEAGGRVGALVQLAQVALPVLGRILLARGEVEGRGAAGQAHRVAQLREERLGAALVAVVPSESGLFLGKIN